VALVDAETPTAPRVKPVFPGAINLQGSIPTPYIFDDRADIRDVAEAIMYWYNTEEHHRESAGMRGRERCGETAGVSETSNQKNLRNLGIEKKNLKTKNCK
jgi:hypothetical protein